MPVVLTYTKLDGSNQKSGIDEEVTKIGFNFDNMITIDLTGIDACKNLQHLEIQGKNLQTLDFSPIKSCKSLHTLAVGGESLQTINLTSLDLCDNLRELWIVGHELQCIDISPLGQCEGLQILGVGGSKLPEIDLSPLNSCSNLSELRIGLTNIHSLNISPLDSCSNLRKLRLGWNKLQTIDLSPLSSCSNLQILNFQKNELQTVDLSPLKGATKLELIDLSENQLNEIDLSALSNCTSLKELLLAENRLQTIDLVPLWSCTNLQNINLAHNNIQSVDFTPISHIRGFSFDETCNGFSWIPVGHKIAYRRPVSIVYERPISTASAYPWALLHQIAKNFGNDRRVQHDILFALGLQNYGFIDCDLGEFLLSIPPHSTSVEAKKQVTSKLVGEIVNSVDRGGVTTGLNLEHLIEQHAEIAIRTQEITRIRDSELRNVHIGVSGDKVDLRELWLTAYGYEILSALRMQLFTDLEGLEFIDRPFSDMGFKLKTNETPISSVHMDKMLKMVILWIIKNRHIPWEEVKPSSLSNWWEELFEQRLNELVLQKRVRGYDRTIAEEIIREFSEFEHVEQDDEAIQLYEELEEDEVKVVEEVNPEEERLFEKGKKMKRREREKQKKEKSRDRVQWRRMDL